MWRPAGLAPLDKETGFCIAADWTLAGPRASAAKRNNRQLAPLLRHAAADGAVRPDYALGPHVAPLGLTFVTGFIDLAKREAKGRPVGVAMDASGALLIADDVGNAVWRVTPVRR